MDNNGHLDITYTDYTFILLKKTLISSLWLSLCKTLINNFSKEIVIKTFIETLDLLLAE